MANLNDVIQRLKDEGYLTRNRSPNSIKALKTELSGIGVRLDAQTKILQNIEFLFSEQAKDAARAAKLKFPQTPNAPAPAPAPGGGAAGAINAVGNLKGGLGMGIGIAAVGAGIAGFIAAITAAGETGFTGEGLPLQARNIALAMNEFAQMDNKAIAIIGGLLTGGVLLSKVSGLGGMLKAPIGMAAVGLGLGGFMAGILGASDGMEWMKIKGDGLADQAKNVTSAMNEFGKLDDKALTILGTMLAGGALFGAVGGLGAVSKAAVGMTAVGLGLGGFMAGIAAAGDISGFTGEKFAAQAKNVAAGLNEFGILNENAVKTLVAIAGAGALIGAVSPMTGAKASVGMGLAGLGIGGFMAGIAAAGDLTGFTGEGFATQSKNVAAGLNEFGTLSQGAINTLVSIAGAGALVGAVSTTIAGKAAVGMGLAGLGIGGFMAGVAAAGDITGFQGDTFAKQAKNMATGLKEFESLSDSTRIGLVAIAGVMTAVTAASPVAGLAVTGGMALAGFGIGSFFVGFETAFKLGGMIGADGSNFATTLGNVMDGIKKASDITLPADGFANYSTAMGNLSAGILKFASADFGASLLNAGTNIVRFFSGESGTGPFDKIIEVADKADAITNVAPAINAVTDALNNLSRLNLSGLNALDDFDDKAKKLISVVPLLDVLANGGSFDPGWFSWEVELRKGLLDPSLRLGEAVEAMGKVRQILSGMGVEMSVPAGYASTPVNTITRPMVQPDSAAVASYLSQYGTNAERNAAIDAAIQQAYQSMANQNNNVVINNSTNIVNGGAGSQALVPSPGQ